MLFGLVTHSLPADEPKECLPCRTQASLPLTEDQGKEFEFTPYNEEVQVQWAGIHVVCEIISIHEQVIEGRSKGKKILASS